MQLFFFFAVLCACFSRSFVRILQPFFIKKMPQSQIFLGGKDYASLFLQNFVRRQGAFRGTRNFFFWRFPLFFAFFCCVHALPLPATVRHVEAEWDSE